MLRSTFLTITVILSLVSLGEAFINKAGTGDVLAGEVKEILWINGKLPEDSEAEGQWLWDKDIKQEGVASHTNKFFKGMQNHSFKTGKVIDLGKGSKLIQYIFIDPKNNPSGIMVRLFLVGEKPVSIYWEGEEEAFVDTDDYITAWYMAPLPRSGEWVRLEIDLKEMDIAEGSLEGMEFISTDGRLWWGKTVVSND